MNSSRVNAGKAAEELNNEIDELEWAPTYTTRKQRPDEKQGDYYHFVPFEVYEYMKENNEVLEFQNFLGVHYFTPKRVVDDLLNEGKNLFMYTNDAELADEIIENCEDVISLYVYEDGLVQKDMSDKYDHTVKYYDEVGCMAAKLLISHKIDSLKNVIGNRDKYPFLCEFSQSKISNKQPISFVIGVPCAGKSTFIKSFFTNNEEIVDLYSAQEALSENVDIFKATIRSYEILTT